MPGASLAVEMVMSEQEAPAPSQKPLTGKQAQHLRGLAHALAPIVHIGKEGLTDAVIAAVDAAIDTHELVKVKLPQLEKEERRAMAAALGAGVSGSVAGVVGRIAILYRRHRDKPVIKLPR
jgi:RNA-binding protein